MRSEAKEAYRGQAIVGAMQKDRGSTAAMGKQATRLRRHHGHSAGSIGVRMRELGRNTGLCAHEKGVAEDFSSVVQRNTKRINVSTGICAN